MNTLQLYISKSSRESARLAEINPSDEGRRAASDLKGAVALVDYPPSAKTVFLIVTNLQSGYAIHIIRTIPPTKPNHLDATIYVDRNLDVMAEDLTEVIETVSDTVLAKAVTEEDMARLRKLFAKEYDVRDKVPRFKPSKGSEYAFLTYGKGDLPSLGDIIAEGLYRPDWSAYKAVCLLDETLAPLPNSMVDLNGTYEEEGEDEPADVRAAAAENVNRQTAGAPTSYVFSIPVILPEGRSELEFELESSHQLQHSPIAGYAVHGRILSGPEKVNRLRQATDKTLYTRFEKWLWGVGGILAGVILMAIIGLFSDSPAERPADAFKYAQQPEQPARTSDHQAKAAPSNGQNEAVAESKPQPLPSDATVYLDNNRIWRLDDMEKIEGLRGLFDDLNSYRFNEITGKWADSLGASKNFAKVVKAAEKSMSKKVDPRRHPDHSPSYNREGDTGIGWLGYTFWIDP